MKRSLVLTTAIVAVLASAAASAAPGGNGNGNGANGNGGSGNGANGNGANGNGGNGNGGNGNGGNGNGGNGNGGGTPTPTPTPTPTLCALNDISPSATLCSGFFSGNILNNNADNISAQQSALLSLGYTWDGDFNAVEKISSLNGSHTVNFGTLLQGISFVAFHFGNGQGGPGNATAFYAINAGTGVDVISLAYNASSNAVLYKTSPVDSVPEPAAWVLMITGFGLVGTALRRRGAYVTA